MVLATLVPVSLAARVLEELGVLAAVGGPLDAFVETMAREGTILAILTARGSHQLSAIPVGLGLLEIQYHVGQLCVLLDLAHA